MRLRTIRRIAAVLVVFVPACAERARVPSPAGTDIYLERDSRVVEARVPANATLTGLLRAHALNDHLVTAVTEAARGVFDLRRLQANHPYRIELTFKGVLRRVEYDIDSTHLLRIANRTAELLLAGHTVTRLEFLAEVVEYPTRRTVETVHGEIDRDHSSLVAAVDELGEGVTLAMALAEIFGGEIDFTNDVQPGDSFDVTFERILRDDELVGYGPVVAASFENGGRRLKAFRFAQPGSRPDYYDENGRSLRRLFLRSPLRFEPRITSRFSRGRMHPVLRQVRSHLGVDYGAPVGAPVVAVSGGVVVSAGPNGDAGRMVQLRHADGFESLYLHLSSISPGLRPGVRVEQGQLVGRVGSSGLATGPHLDYRVKKNGVFINPLLVHRNLPPGVPIAPAHMAAFSAQRDAALLQLARGAASPTPMAARIAAE